jgi:G3E family GTPase
LIVTGPSPATSRPVTVITGFLGSGKTTLLNHLLTDPGMTDTAVIINEFGEVALDHLLVESAIENTVVLQSGCICCTVRGDLVDTLSDLMAKLQAGAIPGFSRVAIETTGLADPVPILQTLATDPLIAPLFRLNTVVTTVDAVNGTSELGGFPEAVKQVALADTVALTKKDLASAQAVSRLKARLRTINPALTILDARHGSISPDAAFPQVDNAPRAATELQRWLRFDAFAADHDAMSAVGTYAHHHDDTNRHDDRIRAFAITLDDPIRWEDLEAWLNSVLSLRGSDMLRVKGILNIVGQPGPVVLHAVQHLLHPLSRLEKWPDEDHRSRIVFITRDIPRAAVASSLRIQFGLAHADNY